MNHQTRTVPKSFNPLLAFAYDMFEDELNEVVVRSWIRIYTKR